MAECEFRIDIDESEHAKRILQRLDSMRKDQKNCDLVIRAEGKEIHVNRDVMCAASDYFDAMFSHDLKEKQEGVVEMKDVRYPAVEKCINYIYSGKIAVSMDECEELLYSASLMQLNEVCGKISPFLEDRLDVKSFFSIRKIAGQFSLMNLSAICDQFALDQLFQLGMEEEFNNLDAEYVSVLLSSKKSSGQRDEDRKMEIILKWIKSDLGRRRKYFLKMTKLFDVSRLTGGYAMFLVNNEPLCMKSHDFLRKIFCGMAVAQQFQETGHPSEMDTSSFSVDKPPNSLFMFDESSKAVQLYQPFKNRLTRMYPYCDGMEESCTACMLGEWLYVFFSNKRTFRLNVASMDSIWNPLDDMLYDHGWGLRCTVHENDIYVGGSDKMERYRVEEGKWENVDLNGNTFEGSALVSCKGFVFCIGGWQNGAHTIRDVVKFSSSSSTWVSVKPMNFARFCASATVFDGKIFVAGGCFGLEDLQEFEMYDVASDLWTLLPEMLLPRCAFHLCVINSQICAVGGYDEDDKAFGVYDITENQWVEHKFNHELDIRALATVSTFASIK